MIPIFISREPDRCPSCGKPESKKELCTHCEYEYKDESLTGKEIALCVFIVIALIWVIMTLTSWLGGFDRSLVDTIINQFKYLSDLRII